MVGGDGGARERGEGGAGEGDRDAEKRDRGGNTKWIKGIKDMVTDYPKCGQHTIGYTGIDI